MSAPSSFAQAWARRHEVARRPDAPGLFVALAPMDGITDGVYRGLLTDQAAGDSGISLCVSEFVRVTRSCVQPHVLLRHCPELAHGGQTRAGVPVYVQLLGGDPGPMADSAVLAAEMGAPGIDINFGCPAKTVNNHDGGATILKTPRRVEAIVSAMRQAVPLEVPISVKVRLGWDCADAIAEIARAAEAGGGAWLTIHARTRTQLYRPPVDWAALERAREAVSFPVVANGDINTVADLQACANVSGCHAFMIGRGAMGRPHLFRQVRGDADPDFDRGFYLTMLLDYAERLIEVGAPERAALGRIKQWLRLGAVAFATVDQWFQQIKVLKTLAEAREHLSRFRMAPLSNLGRQAPDLAAAAPT